MIHKRNTRRKEFRRFFGALFRPKELVELRFIESSTSKDNGEVESLVHQGGFRLASFLAIRQAY